MTDFEPKPREKVVLGVANEPRPPMSEEALIELVWLVWPSAISSDERALLNSYLHSYYGF
jgi:hypothetical protein